MWLFVSIFTMDLFNVQCQPLFFFVLKKNIIIIFKLKKPTTNEMVLIAPTYYEEQGIMGAVCKLI